MGGLAIDSWYADGAEVGSISVFTYQIDNSGDLCACQA